MCVSEYSGTNGGEDHAEQGDTRYAEERVPVERLTVGSLFRVRPGTIRLRFGTPIETTGLAPGERRALALRAHEAVVMLKRQAG